MLIVRELSCHIRSVQVLHPLGLVVQPGERVAMLGPNGAGKSTLLSCVSGDRSGTNGSIWLGPHNLSDYPRRQSARQIAVMPQKVDMAFPFLAHQVVALGRAPYADEQSTLDWQQQAMTLTHTWHLRDMPYHRLSGGEQQRVQLARVVVQIWNATQPESRDDNFPEYYLLLDECTSALDPAHQHRVMQSVSQLCQHQVGILAVMHDVALAASWADRVLLLKEGRMIASGSVELLTDAALMAECYELSASLARQYAASNQSWLDSRP